MAVAVAVAVEYCQSCVLPNTRPGVSLNADGVCQGCINAAQRSRIDWKARASEFARLAENTRRQSTTYDCVIPVSGGKDSFWQVLTCLEHGLHPLCVTYAYPGRSPLGEQNLRSLVEIGVDHIDFRLNPRVERAFVDKAFRKTGISGLVSHMAIYSYPVRVALTRGIPLVVYGENSAWEYGTEDDRLMGSRVDRAWLASFGVTAGTTAEDWVDDELSATDLAPLTLPSDTELESTSTRAIFLGHYFRWDPKNSLRVAKAAGFQSRAEGPRVGHYDFVNIDDDMIGVHHHLKWHKFGVTRSWDTLSMEIRNGRLSRADAVRALRDLGDETPWDDIRVFCGYLGMSQDDYFRIAEGFRNEKLWSRRDGRWVIDGFLVPDFPWPEDPSGG